MHTPPIFASNAIPTPHILLFALAAITPAHLVPCLKRNIVFTENKKYRNIKRLVYCQYGLVKSNVSSAGPSSGVGPSHLFIPLFMFIHLPLIQFASPPRLLIDFKV